MSELTDEDPACDLCGEPIDLGQRGTLEVRHAHSGDEQALGQLYASLAVPDLLTRFFTAGQPSMSFLERWVSVASRCGLCLLVEVEHEGDRRVIAEAGFAPLADGDVELGITVAPEYRGWIGAWLLDLLLTHAAVNGVSNMQALVKTSNRRMLELIKHRGCARFEDSDWETTRVTMATSGHTPNWPPDAASPRVLIESPRPRPDIARRVRQQSGTTLICGGFGRPESHCPLHSGEPCPLIDGADAVVLDALETSRPPADTEDLRSSIEHVHPDAHLVVVEQPDGLPHRQGDIDLGLPSDTSDRQPKGER